MGQLLERQLVFLREYFHFHIVKRQMSCHNKRKRKQDISTIMKKKIKFLAAAFVILLVAVLVKKENMGTERELKEEKVENVSDSLSGKYIETDHSVEFSGRWFPKEINGKNMMVTVNDGAMLYFKTEGTDYVTAEFTEISQLETPYFAYIIDEGEPVRQKITDGAISLPDQGEHVVQIVVDGMAEREDKWNGEIGVAFHKIVSHGGKITGVVPEKKRIMFIGDSITEGVMALGNVAVSGYNSATHSFPWYTAKELDAEPYFVGFGATGIVETGSFNNCSNMLDYYSASRAAEIPECDLIVLNTGTNDLETDSSTFIEGYKEVVLKLHDRYPDVQIVCMIPFTQLHGEDIHNAVTDYPWCYVADTAEWKLTYTDGIHPDREGARKAAEYLAEYIKMNF